MLSRSVDPDLEDDGRSLLVLEMERLSDILGVVSGCERRGRGGGAGLGS